MVANLSVSYAANAGNASIATYLQGFPPAVTDLGSTVVQRDANGNFAASTITATTFTGNASNAANSALLTGLAPATANTASTIVQRDANGSFSAGVITATTFNGNISAGMITANFTGNLTGTASNAANSSQLQGYNATGFVQIDESGLKIIRGEVSSSGTILIGSNFTANWVSAGVYLITYSAAFSGPTSVTITPVQIGFSIVSNTTASNATIRTYDANQNPANNSFYFIACGLK
jgi:hypothetical protein